MEDENKRKENDFQRRMLNEKFEKKRAYGCSKTVSLMITASLRIVSVDSERFRSDSPDTLCPI